MAEDESTPEAEAPVAESKPPADPRRSFLRRHWWKLTIATVLIVPVVVFAIWSVLTLAYSYSDGNRVGYVQKLSRKGWICKTWEGELQLSNIPGSAPVVFQFSVRSDSLARVIESLGGRQVQIFYEQHLGVPTSCFGETEYFVVGVREVSKP